MTRRLFAASVLGLAVGCAATRPQPMGTPEIEPLPEPPPKAAEAAEEAGGKAGDKSPPAGHGGRLFDAWYAELDVAFVPDDPKTKELDGKGGPFGNGTLPDSTGKPMPNSGHDYRLKNLFGWDLRGQQGLYGPEHFARKGVLVPSVLADTDTRAHWIERLTRGGDAIPAYGGVLSEADVAAVVDFMLGVREGRLAQPEAVYLPTETEGHYRLREGGDAARGQALFAQRCAECHGEDGTEMYLADGKHSLGSLGRSRAHVVFMKMLSGQPGTPMHRQLTGDAATQAQEALDLLTALCDRTRYPLGEATGEDVADGDPRCGPALK